MRLVLATAAFLALAGCASAGDTQLAQADCKVHHRGSLARLQPPLVDERSIQQVSEEEAGLTAKHRRL